MLRMTVGWLALLVMVTGCGKDGVDARAACEDAQANICERIYACYTPAELAELGFPSNEAACVTMLQGAQGCAQQTEANACTGNEKFHADQADLCIDQISGLSCSQIRDSELDIERAAPACGKVCSVD